MATKVTLRKKAISGDRESLYLDFYPAIHNPDNGKPTRREFLGMYLYTKAKTPVEKEQNKETLILADNIRATRQLEIQRGEYGFLSTTKKKADFVAYFTTLAEKRKGSNSDNWQSVLNYLKDFTGGSLLFSNLTEHVCNEFKEHLQTVKSKRSTKTNLSPNSVLSYFNKFQAALKQAYKDGYLETDLNKRIERVKPEETQREILTIEELNKLAQTDCAMPLLKEAALFTALTGMRVSDALKLTWSEVQHTKATGYFIQYRQQKTKNVETLPISEQAFELLGERREPEARVFEGLKYSAHTNSHIVRWTAKAGITKHITFHNFRHTYATILLDLGVAPTTIQKNLGHKHLKTTLEYTKIKDENKRKAANMIHIDFGKK